MDQVTRGAARWATLAAVPLAAAAGVLVFTNLNDAGRPTATPSTPPASATTQPVPGAPVAIAAGRLSARQTTVCRALTAQLPADVRGLPQRKVTAGPEQNAAYGEPPITLACGVPKATFPPTDDVYRLNTVCWHARPGNGGTIWTTVDREVPVQLTIPTAYEPAGQWAIPFANPIAAAIPSLAEGGPTGCTQG